MGRRYPIAEARNNLPSLVREAESGKAVELTRRGEAVAVIIGCRQYERLTSHPGRFSEAYLAFTRDFNLEELDIDPDALFSAARDDTRGREISL